VVELLRAAEVPPGANLLVCRHPPGRSAFVAVVVALGGAGLLWHGLRRESVLALYLGGLTLLVLLIFRRLVLATFRPSNWLLRADAHGVYIQFRSYLNHRLSASDRTVAFFPYQSITLARKVIERRETAERDVDDQRMVRTYDQEAIWLEIVSNARTSELARALEAEVVRRPATGALYRDYLVRVSADRVIQARWEVTPSVETCLAFLSAHVTVGSPAAEVRVPADCRRRPPEPVVAESTDPHDVR